MADSSRDRVRTRRGSNDAPDPKRRASSVHRIVLDPSDIMQNLFAGRGNLTRDERDYLSKQSPARREALLQGMESMSAATQTPLRFRILDSNLPDKSDILNRLGNGDASSKYEAWVSAALRLPLGRLSTPPVAGRTDIARWLADARTQMDAALWGQHRAKDEAVRMLCQWASAGATGSFAIGLQVGRTKAPNAMGVRDGAARERVQVGASAERARADNCRASQALERRASRAMCLARSWNDRSPRSASAVCKTRPFCSGTATRTKARPAAASPTRCANGACRTVCFTSTS